MLDTHIWLWSLLDPGKLNPRVLRALRLKTNELWLSPISTWELLVLVKKGRVTLDGDPQAWIDEALKCAPMTEAPLTHEIARQSMRVKLPHQDPADRFLAATAKVLNLLLVTADRRILRARDIKTLANR